MPAIRSAQVVVALGAVQRAAIVDLIENALNGMVVVDREDARWHAALITARQRIMAATPVGARTQ